MSRTGRTSTSEPGRNARTFSISTVKPPLTRPVMTPVTISDLLNASSSRVQVRARLAFSRDRRVSPVPSSTESSATSTSSPALTSTSPRSFLNCSRGMTASDLRPTLTMTTSPVTSTIEPGQDHSGADALVSETLLEELGETFCHTFTLPRVVAVASLDPHPLRARQVNYGHRASCACLHSVTFRPNRRSSGLGPQRAGRPSPAPARRPPRSRVRSSRSPGIGRGLQRGDRSGRIPQIPLG